MVLPDPVPFLAGVLGLVVALVVAVVAGRDAARRGRSAGWGVAVFLLPPLWMPFLLIAVLDRHRGRPGIPLLARDRRVLARTVLVGSVLVGAFLVSRPIEVPPTSGAGEGWSARSSGDCGNALEVGSGARTLSQPDAPAGMRAFYDRERARCSEVAGRRLATAWSLAAGGGLLAVVLLTWRRSPTRDADADAMSSSLRPA